MPDILAAAVLVTAPACIVLALVLVVNYLLERNGHR